MIKWVPFNKIAYNLPVLFGETSYEIFHMLLNSVPFKEKRMLLMVKF